MIQLIHQATPNLLGVVNVESFELIDSVNLFGQLSEESFRGIAVIIHYVNPVCFILDVDSVKYGIIFSLVLFQAYYYRASNHFF
jgi:hypothetical protein